MKTTDLVLRSLEESRGYIEDNIKKLTEEELSFQPKPHSNSIIFLMWHLARIEDLWINRLLLGAKEIYEADSWYLKFGTAIQDNGFGYDPARLAAWPVPKLALVLSYASAVRTKTRGFLSSLNDTTLDEAKDFGWSKGTVGSALSHLVTEVGEHSGQIGYIKGIMKGIEPMGPPPKTR